MWWCGLVWVRWLTWINSAQWSQAFPLSCVPGEASPPVICPECHTLECTDRRVDNEVLDSQNQKALRRMQCEWKQMYDMYDLEASGKPCMRGSTTTGPPPFLTLKTRELNSMIPQTSSHLNRSPGLGLPKLLVFSDQYSFYKHSQTDPGHFLFVLQGRAMKTQLVLLPIFYHIIFGKEGCILKSRKDIISEWKSLLRKGWAM